MTKKARIAAAVASPIIASLAFVGMSLGTAAPAGAAPAPIIINLPGLYIQITL